MSKNTIEFNTETMPGGYSAFSKTHNCISLHSKAGTISISQSLYRKLNLAKAYGIKFKLIKTDLYIYSSNDKNAFVVRVNKAGNMLSHSLLTRKILELVDTNIYSATLEVVDTENGMLVNTNEPLRLKKGAPA